MSCEVAAIRNALSHSLRTWKLGTHSLFVRYLPKAPQKYYMSGKIASGLLQRLARLLRWDAWRDNLLLCRRLFLGGLRGVQPQGLKSFRCCDDQHMHIGGNYHP